MRSELSGSSVWVVVPAFNEAGRLASTLRALCPLGHQVVVVDDGSSDATAEVALRSPVWLLRTALLSAALVAIAQPELTTRFAHAVGDGRGADLVLYLFVVAFLFASFAFYSRSVKLKRQVTVLAGKLAQLEAQRGAEAAQEPPRG